MAQTHSVAAGDTLIRIAEQYGFSDWRTIWQHPGNDELRARRDDPQVLSPGDQVFVPDPTPARMKVSTNQIHRFRLVPPRAQVRLRLVDPAGAPFADKKCTLTIASGTLETKTDGDGLAIFEVPRDLEEATVELWPEEEGESMKEKLLVGHLDPVSEPSGVRARLNNLGFSCGDNASPLDETTAAWLGIVQSLDDHERVSGEPDESTEQALLRRHGA